LVPLKDGGESKPLKKQSSFGSDKGLSTSERGQEDTLEYRIDTKNDEGKTISLWHDINVNHIDTDGNETEYLNFVCEIPKFTRKKYEIATDEEFTPIKQDEKKGKLREFKKGDIFFNYGCLPQTWEDPTFIHPDAEGCRGDNDPVDVCEIGARIIQPGVSHCLVCHSMEELHNEPEANMIDFFFFLCHNRKSDLSRFLVSS